MSFIVEYGNTIIYALITAVFSFIGLTLKKEITKYLNLKEKKEVVRTCVLASNQLYKDKTGEERYNLTIENVRNILTLRELPTDDFEIRIMIGEVCETENCSHFE